VPCVLLHGFTGSPAAWDDVIAHWQHAEHAPVAIALPGHGGGDVAASWDANLAQVADAIAARGAAGAPIVGYSLGARVALGLLATGRAPCAILIGVHPGLADGAERAMRQVADAAWAARLRHWGIAGFAAAWEAQPVLAAAHADPDARARRGAIRRAHDPLALAASLDHMGLAAMPDLTAALIARAARAHLVVGAGDAKFAPIARALVAAAPGLGLDVIDGSGHDPTLDQPAALAAVIATGLRRLT
jgi:2-succinyl-6-hydroxy-2,4-cyclohexadiene-1-carboxylate synthase